MTRTAGWFLALALALFVAVPAFGAATQPSYGPPPAWVDVAPIPTDATPDGGASQTLLDDNQTRLSPDGDTYYNRRVGRVLKPEGLKNLTSFGATWDPDTETVTFHTIAIIRDGRTIDLLDAGKKMLVIRRERDLEHAMLDGRLTASQQLEGLQVGDIIDVAWTTTRHEPLFKGRSYDSEGMAFVGKANRFRVIVSWPDGAGVRWKPTPGFGEPQVSRRDGRTSLSLDIKDALAPKPPIGAPLRFRRLGVMEASGFQSWSDVSKIMAPLYAEAAQLDPNSPLKAEAAAIARSKDAKVRAFAALQLVEDRTRYFLLGMGDGGYVPARADETWSRKFGDCKGKTALLLALLRELHIQAEPALVNLGGGDGMNERLPSAQAFNHVIVRAVIDGKVYWLDGTRAGDRAGLEELRPPSHRWALPVRAEGAELEEIKVPPLDAPTREVVMRFDASKGVDEPAPVQVMQRYRGDAANALRQAVASIPRADLERNFRESFSRSMSWVELDTIHWRDDAANDAFEVRLTGKAELDWRKNPDVGALEYRVAAGGRSGAYPRREPGLNSDAPFAISYPSYTREITEFVLPSGGAGYTIRGPNDEETVGGYQLKRVSTLAGGIARFSTESRSLTPEIPAADAAAATKTLRRLAQDDTLIRAPL